LISALKTTDLWGLMTSARRAIMPVNRHAVQESRDDQGGKMARLRMRYAELDKARLEKVRALEEELGSYVVAFEPKIPFARLTQDQLKRLQAAEDELGVVLLAYDRE
jgi:hypothetical protein